MKIEISKAKADYEIVLLYKDEIKKAADFFKVVGDETRMKILLTIREKEACVNDIAKSVEMTKSAVSHQLKLLRDENLIKSRRDGKNICMLL